MKYFEDFMPGEVQVVGEYELTKREIIAFAGQWDPQAQHIEESAARNTGFGGLIAPGVQLVALAVRLLVEQEPKVALEAAVGWDAVRFKHPVRPGERLTLLRECIESRPSKSKADRGIVRNRVSMRNHHGQIVLTFEDTILVRKRNAAPINSGVNTASPT